IQAFGAVPGDQHNDNVAIQKAIDQASENGGGVVYIPSGVYLIGKALNINASSVTLKGNGRSSVLKNNGTKLAIIKSVSNDHSLENVIIERLAINGVDQTVTGIMGTGLTRGCLIAD